MRAMKVEVTEVIDHRTGERYYWVSYAGTTEIFNDKIEAFKKAKEVAKASIKYTQGQDRR